MSARLKFASLGLPPGRWRLRWIGRFARPATTNQLPSLTAFFRRQHAPSSDPVRLADAATSELFKTTIPIAQLVHFPLLTSVDVSPAISNAAGSGGSVGTIRRAVRAETRVIQKKLCFDRQNLELVERVGSSNTPSTLPSFVQNFLRAEGLPRAWRDDRDYSSHLLCFKKERVLIPCVEVFRALYARDSKFAQFYFDGKFAQPHRFLFNPERGIINEDTAAAHIWLRQWVDDIHAPFVAHFAFDEFALKRAQQILNDQAAGHFSGEMTFKVWPHFEGTWQTVLRCPLRSGSLPDQSLVVASRIDQCHWVPKFHSLVWDRDNDSRRQAARASERAEATATGEHSGFGRSPNKARSESTDESPLITNDGRANRDEADIHVSDEALRDPLNLRSIHAKKQPAAEGGAASGAKSLRERQESFDALVTTARTNGGGAVCTPVVLKFAEAPRAGDRTDSRDLSSVTPSDLRELATSLKNCGDIPGCETKFLAVWPTKSLGDGVDIFALPRMVRHDRQPAWLFVHSDKQKPRLAFALQMKVRQEEQSWTRIVVDIQAMIRFSKSTVGMTERRDSIFVFDVLSEEGSLSDAVADVLRARAVVDRNFYDIVASHHLKLGRRKHVFDASFLKDSAAVLAWIGETDCDPSDDTASDETSSSSAEYRQTEVGLISAPLCE